MEMWLRTLSPAHITSVMTEVQKIVLLGGDPEEEFEGAPLPQLG